MDFKKLVDKTIDDTIRGFDEHDQGSYDRWDRELRGVEDSLRVEESELDPLLLASVCTERIRIAFESHKLKVTIEKTADFLREFPSTVPGFSYVLSLRASALHEAGAHDEEIQEVLQAARKPELWGSEYVYLLASLGDRHPGCLSADEDLWQKLLQSIDDLRAQGYDTLLQPSEGPERLEVTVRRTADELRRVNRARGEALLT